MNSFWSIFLIFVFCFGKPVKFVDAAKQNWVGGIGATKGINYTVKFVAKKSSDKIFPLSVQYSNGKKLKFIILKDNKKLNFKSLNFNKGDTLIFKCSYNENTKFNDKAEKVNYNKLIFNFKCLKNNKTKFVEVTDFIKLKPLMYP